MLIPANAARCSIGLKENPPGASGGFFVTGLAPLSDDERQNNQRQQHARCVHGLTCFLGREDVRPRGRGAEKPATPASCGPRTTRTGTLSGLDRRCPRRMPDERAGRLPCGRPRGLQLAGVGLPAPSQGVKQDGPRRTGTGPWAALWPLSSTADSRDNGAVRYAPIVRFLGISRGEPRRQSTPAGGFCL
jgi:hypothetical protein